MKDRAQAIFTFTNVKGLHARTASRIIDVVQKMNVDCLIHYGHKSVNAKSILSLLTLGVECGSQVEVACTGQSAHFALKKIGELIEQKFLEEEACEK